MDTHLSTRQAAALLGITQRTLANWRCWGLGPPSESLGRRVRYLPADLDAFTERWRLDPSLTSAARRRPARSPKPTSQSSLAPAATSLTPSTPNPPPPPQEQLQPFTAALKFGSDLALERLDHEKTRKALEAFRNKSLALEQELAQALNKIRQIQAPPVTPPAQNPHPHVTTLKTQLQTATEANETLAQYKAHLQKQHRQALAQIKTLTADNQALKDAQGQLHLQFQKRHSNALDQIKALTTDNQALKDLQLQLQAQFNDALNRLAAVPDTQALHRTIEGLQAALATDRTAAIVLHVLTASTESLAAWYLEHVKPNGRTDSISTDKMRRRCLHRSGFKLVGSKLNRHSS